MRTILIVDDEPDMRDSIKSHLEGFLVVEAAHGKAAFATITSSRVDLVITDIFMPEMDGLELIQVLRQQAPTVRIIAISGGGRFDLAASQLNVARSVGADALLTKPFSMDELKAAIEQLLPGAGGDGSEVQRH